MKSLVVPLAVAVTLFACVPAFAAEKITVEEAMQRSGQTSLAAKISGASKDEAEAREWQTWMTMGPRVDLEANKVWVSKSVNKAVGQTLGGQKIPERVTNGSFTIAQPITPLFALLEKARIDAKLSEAAVRESVMSEQDARYAGAEAFLRAVKAKAFLQIANSSYGVVEKQRHDAEILQQNGVLSNTDVYRLDLALADAKAQTISAQNTFEVAIAALSETVGQNISQDVVLEHPEESYWERKKPSLRTVEDFVSTADKQRPEIAAAENRADAAGLSIAIAYADYFPTVNFFAKYERDFEATDINVPEVKIPPSGPVLQQAVSYKKSDIQNSLTYGLNLKWNIWDWGSRYKKTSELTASAQKAKYAAEATHSRVRLEARQAFLEFRSLVESLETAKAALKFAEETYRLTELKFRSGSASTTDLIGAERDQTRARAGLINTRSDLDLAWLKLRKSVGEAIAFE